jgi:hypothetical protein
MARNDMDRTGVVILGASRTQAGIDPQVLSEELRGPVTQLAINGASPLPILEDLAADASFKGTVIVGVAPGVVFDSMRRTETTARIYLAAYRRFLSSPALRSEARLSALLHRVVRFRNPELTLLRIANSFRSGRMPRVAYGRERADRMMLLDFSRTSAKRLERELLRRFDRRESKGRGANIGEVVGRLKQPVEQIRSRGGRVVFLRMPSGGEVRAREKRYYPRSENWDRLAAVQPRVTIHSEDFVELSGFSPPDGSHLDFRDSKGFTLGLAGVIARLDRGSGH